MLDDSKTMLLLENGNIAIREENSKDLYIFAFGNNFYKGLKQFFDLTGYPPMLPKFVFGNWWSRYHAYSDTEYLDLMTRFEKEKIPFTVATIDMDWHLVEDVPKDNIATNKSQGRGWTGYTWNKKLFPDYKTFLKKLKDKNLKVAMNLHPRDGVRYFETQYEDMAKANGIDPTSKQAVEFDLTSEKFITSYFDILHHPYEKDGVDFWWIDWQQGKTSKIKGLDPLWLLNHYHYLDNCRNNNKGLILSRYAGVGSHRYPLGFSGDTFVSWAALNFQPYFTANSSNIGYTWWSHDIGGHMCNMGNEELYLRWLELGVFSPINRFHSTNTTLSKEPWNYPAVKDMAQKYLQLRHKLIPYLYTASIRTATEGLPLICPLYYSYDSRAAYSRQFRNEFLFGSEILVCPVTKKGNKVGTVKQKIYIPKGKWFDFFTGKEYVGDNIYTINCSIDYIPVFVKEGGIVPMLANADNNDMCYKNLEIKVYVGNGSYTLYDEVGRLDISQKITNNTYSVQLVPQDNINIEKIKISFPNIKTANIKCGDIETNGKEIVIDNSCATITLENIEI